MSSGRQGRKACVARSRPRSHWLNTPPARRPVLAIQPADDEAHAIELAESTRSVLIARVWTDDDARFGSVARRLSVGGVIQSDTPTAWDAPFCGVKHS
ncbi:aldehyde dehydrogenase family protein [Nonomuraea sp. NPDC049695]|uniref:aldehyde dehydrogenase family protein n=1 Tax=Nonomuraea sp. NPDC049695 TaxID=3154734 RepID=UPI00343B8DB1